MTVKYFALPLLLLNLLVMSFAVPQAFAEVEHKRYTQLSIYPERYALQAGESLDIAIEQIIAPHWHTYWKNPGDSGSKPVYDWALPEGWSIGEIQYPTPQKIPYGPMVNYGYSHKAVMLQTLQAPADYDGAPVTITADLEVLVCEDICIPEFDTISFTLNDPQSVDFDKDNSAIISSARAAMPLNGGSITGTYYEEGQDFVVRLSLPENMYAEKASNAYIIPADWGMIDNAAKPEYFIDGDNFVIRQKRGDRALSDIQDLRTLFTIEVPTDRPETYSIIVKPSDQSAAERNLSLGTVLLMALVGGLILNLMPCVFPILSIKALSLVKMAQESAGKARAHGIAYTAGILVSFLAIAGALIALQLGGAQIGWGFQLQNPLVIIALSYLLFIVGLNFAGLFELRNPFANVGQKATQGGGISGAFFTGVLATLVATPCTAPFMASAIGYAFTQPPLVNLVIFTALGLGLALPFLLLAFVPALQKFLPKPGAWMRNFQQFLAFPMFLAVVWLLSVLAKQSGIDGVLHVLLGFVGVSFAIWVWGKGRAFGRILAVLSLISVLVSFVFMPKDSNLDFEPYSPTLLEQALANKDQPIFVEMTAQWCITCKINNATSINVAATHDVFGDNNVRYIVGDWTDRDDHITEYLQEFQRNGVPLYVFYPAAGEDGQRPEPVLLPQILTPSIVAKAIENDYININQYYKEPHQ